MNATTVTVTVSASPTPTPTETPVASSHSNVGAIAGGVIGGVGLLFALLSALLIQRRVKRRRKFETTYEPAAISDVPGHRLRIPRSNLRESDQEKHGGPAELPGSSTLPITIEEWDSRVPSRPDTGAGWQPANKPERTKCSDGPLYEGDGGMESLKRSLSANGCEGRRQGEIGDQAKSGPSGSKLEKENRDPSDVEPEKASVKQKSPDITDEAANSSTLPDELDNLATTAATKDDDPSMISRVADVATSAATSGHHGIGQSDAGGIAGAVVGGLGLAVGGGALYHQKKQLKLQQKETELRETESSLTRRVGEMEQRLSQVEGKEESLKAKAAELKEETRELKIKELSLNRERKALELQRRDISTGKEADIKALTLREKELMARGLELSDKSRLLEERESAVQESTSVIHKKDSELRELEAHNQNLKATQKALEEKIQSLSQNLHNFEESEQRWRSELGRLPRRTGVFEDTPNGDSLDVLLPTTDELVQNMKKQFEVLQNAQANAEEIERHHIDDMAKARAAWRKAEEDGVRKEQKANEEVEAFHGRCSKLQEQCFRLQTQLRSQQEPVIKNSCRARNVPAAPDPKSPSEEVDYDQEIQDALEQVSRLKKRFTALQNRKIDSVPQSKPGGVSTNTLFEPVVAFPSDEVLQASDQEDVLSSSSTVSERSSDVHLSEDPDSNTSGSIHDNSMRNDRNERKEGPASHDIGSSASGTAKESDIIDERKHPAASQRRWADAANPWKIDCAGADCEGSDEAVSPNAEMDASIDVSFGTSGAEKVIGQDNLSRSDDVVKGDW